MEDIEIKKADKQITVLQGHRRLETILEIEGEAIVLCEGKPMRVAKNKHGELVEVIVLEMPEQQSLAEFPTLTLGGAEEIPEDISSPVEYDIVIIDK